jgi:hypothetical protein
VFRPLRPLPRPAATSGPSMDDCASHVPLLTPYRGDVFAPGGHVSRTYCTSLLLCREIFTVCTFQHRQRTFCRSLHKAERETTAESLRIFTPHLGAAPALASRVKPSLILCQPHHRPTVPVTWPDQHSASSTRQPVHPLEPPQPNRPWEQFSFSLSLQETCRLHLVARLAASCSASSGS